MKRRELSSNKRSEPSWARREDSEDDDDEIVIVYTKPPKKNRYQVYGEDEKPLVKKEATVDESSSISSGMTGNEGTSESSRLIDQKFAVPSSLPEGVPTPPPPPTVSPSPPVPSATVYHHPPPPPSSFPSDYPSIPSYLSLPPHHFPPPLPSQPPLPPSSRSHHHPSLPQHLPQAPRRFPTPFLPDFTQPPPSFPTNPPASTPTPISSGFVSLCEPSLRTVWESHHPSPLHCPSSSTPSPAPVIPPSEASSSPLSDRRPTPLRPGSGAIPSCSSLLRDFERASRFHSDEQIENRVRLSLVFRDWEKLREGLTFSSKEWKYCCHYKWRLSGHLNRDSSVPLSLECLPSPYVPTWSVRFHFSVKLEIIGRNGRERTVPEQSSGEPFEMSNEQSKMEIFRLQKVRGQGVTVYVGVDMFQLDNRPLVIRRPGLFVQPVDADSLIRVGASSFYVNRACLEVHCPLLSSHCHPIESDDVDDVLKEDEEAFVTILRMLHYNDWKDPTAATIEPLLSIACRYRILSVICFLERWLFTSSLLLRLPLSVSSPNHSLTITRILQLAIQNTLVSTQRNVLSSMRLSDCDHYIKEAKYLPDSQDVVSALRERKAELEEQERTTRHHINCQR